MPRRATPPAPPVIDPAGVPRELRLRAAAPLPPMRPVADFVALPTGSRSLDRVTRQQLVDRGAAGWAVVATGASLLGAGRLAQLVSWPGALAVLLAAVGVPAGLAARRLLGLLLAAPPPVSRVRPATPVTVLLAGTDPAATVASIAGIAAQDYGGPLAVLAVADVPTARAAHQAALDRSVRLDAIPTPAAGDPRGAGLARVVTPLVLAVEPGVVLHPSALRLLVARLDSCPASTVAVAAPVVARNRRTTPGAEALAGAWTVDRAAGQQLDALVDGPLVADRPCTLFRTDALQAVNGWPPGRAADVVAAWRLLERGWTLTTEPQALTFAAATVTGATPGRERVRAARGVRAAAHESGGVTRLPGGASRAAARLTTWAPTLDRVCAAGWLVALALVPFGAVGPLVASLLLVAPCSVAALEVGWHQQRDVLDEAGLWLGRPPRRWCALLAGVDPARSLLAGWGSMTASRGPARTVSAA